MLVLSRKRDQSILVGDIRICVLSIKGHRVRIGIDAPANVPIRRGELFDGQASGLPPLDDQPGLVIHDDGE